jgi:hypothetical protein
VEDQVLFQGFNFLLPSTQTKGSPVTFQVLTTTSMKIRAFWDVPRVTSIIRAVKIRRPDDGGSTHL